MPVCLHLLEFARRGRETKSSVSRSLAVDKEFVTLEGASSCEAKNPASKSLSSISVKQCICVKGMGATRGLRP